MEGAGHVGRLAERHADLRHLAKLRLHRRALDLLAAPLAREVGPLHGHRVGLAVVRHDEVAHVAAVLQPGATALGRHRRLQASEVAGVAHREGDAVRRADVREALRALRLGVAEPGRVQERHDLDLAIEHAGALLHREGAHRLPAHDGVVDRLPLVRRRLGAVEGHQVDAAVGAEDRRLLELVERDRAARAALLIHRAVRHREVHVGAVAGVQAARLHDQRLGAQADHRRHARLGTLAGGNLAVVGAVIGESRRCEASEDEEFGAGHTGTRTEKGDFER